MAGPKKYNIPVSVPELRIQRGAQDRYNGLTVKKIASAVFDTAGVDSSGVSNKTAAAHGTGVYIPDNAIITKLWFDVITTFTSDSTDAGTIALSTEGAGDGLVAIAISDASNVFDAGIHHGIPGSYPLGADAEHDTALEVGALMAASFLKMTSENEIVATVAVEALLLGKMIIYVEYTISE